MSHLSMPAIDLAGRVVAPPQTLPAARPAGPWDGNRPPVVGDRVARHGTVDGITARPVGGGFNVSVRGDDGTVTETSLVDFARTFSRRAAV